MHAFTTACTSASASNWYFIILLKISSRKNTKWWLVAFENRNQGVENACNSSTTEFCSATSQTRGRAGVKAMDLAFQRTGYKNVHWLRKTPDWPLHTLLHTLVPMLTWNTTSVSSKHNWMYNAYDHVLVQHRSTIIILHFEDLFFEFLKQKLCSLNTMSG